ncbi:MAG TPA: MupA/Atu3671 family FMN-dependent luciferase-like monooxygenase [Conexibacter sp.]|nr:MupA/Atu3671 family FMN-dependent luciferase-like monooxygenase [Conexibacter sp.]
MSALPHGEELYVLPLSAEAPDALAELRHACAAFVRARAALAPADLLHSALRRRSRAWRAVALGRTREQLAEALAHGGADLLEGEPAAAGGVAAAPRAAWLLGGGGAAQRAAVRVLCAQLAPCRALVERHDGELRSTLGVEPLAWLAADDAAPPRYGAEAAVVRAVLELALVELWRTCAPPPALVAGCGAGAVLALCVAGALSEDDALRLVAAQLVGDGAALARTAERMAWRPLTLPLVRAGDGVVLPPLTTLAAGSAGIASATDDAGLAGALAAQRPAHLVDFGGGAVAAGVAERLGPDVRTLRAGGASLAALVVPLAQAWCDGAEVDLAALLGAHRGAIVPLPAAPLGGRRIWPERRVPAAAEPPAVPLPAAEPQLVPEPQPLPEPEPEAEPEAPPSTLTTPVEDGGLPAVLEAIRALAGRELGIAADEVPDDATFFDLGADSLLMINMLRELEHAFGVKVAMRELFEEADSPAALARLVASRRPAAAPPAAAQPAPAPVVPAPAPAAPAAPAAAPPPLAPPAAPADSPPPPVHGPRVAVPRAGGMAGGRLTPAQQAHLERLTAALTARTRRSKELAARFRGPLADSRASVGFRSATKELLYPIAARSAAGSRLEDVDGNAYVDITMGFGILLFGHDPPFLREAVAEHLAHGIRLGPRSEDTGLAAELLCELTGAERVAFATSGTEANSAAIRVARAATGRDRIAFFHGAYHGHFDSMLARGAGPPGRRTTIPVSSGIPQSAVDAVSVLDYDESALEAIARDGDELAAVVVEPVQSRNPDRQPRELLVRLRELTERHGIVLVFDEMLTGFRSHPRGAQGLFGVEADLVTYGKLLGGGFPIGAIAGRRELLDRVDGGDWRYGDDSQPTSETTFFGGTYVQHPVAMAAARATLAHLREQGPQLQERLNALTDRLAARLNDHFAAERYPLRVAHFGSQFRFVLERDLDLLFSHLLLKGIYVWEWRNFFLSTAHTDADVDRVAGAVASSLAELRDAGWIPPAAAPARPPRAAARSAAGDARAPRFSLYYFGSYPRETPPEERYELLFESARFADDAGFDTLWVPERHFHAFGGIFPNPSLLAAALARETRRIRLHAGSVVLPLHNPIRVAEEWSVVDNLSGGRVGIGVASGWHANDFALRPEAYGRHKDAMYEGLETVKALWRGDAVAVRSGSGEQIEVRLHPPPLQPCPPLYTAIVGAPESWERAGRSDLGVITNLMTQDLDQLTANVTRYRAARAAAGLDPAAGPVVVLLHTYLAAGEQQARADAFEPFCAYLRSSLSLFGQATNSLGMEVDVEGLSKEDLDYVLRRAFASYCDARALIGTPASCEAIARRVLAAGADEIACFVDFGISLSLLRRSLPRMVELRDRLRPAAPRSRAPAEAAVEIEVEVEVEATVPLALAQERIWFVEQLHDDFRGHLEPSAIRLRGALDPELLAAVLEDVARNQPMLRGRVVHDGRVPALEVLRELPVGLAVDDVAGRDEQEVVDAAMAQASAHRFELARGPLWSARLLRFGPEQHVLLLSFHHIIFDALAAACFARELSRCYAARLRGERPPARASLDAYAAYARRQREQLGTPAVEDALRHWQELLTPLPPPLELPTDHPRPATYASAGACVTRRLGRDLTGRLDAFARTARVTPFMCLTTALAQALRAWSGQEAFALGTPIADRPPELMDTIGLCVNMLALRVDLTGTTSFDAALRAVREVLLDAHEHAAAPFEEVVRRVNPPRDPSRSPIFQVVLELDGALAFDFELPGIAVEALDATPSKAPFDVALYLSRSRGELHCRFEYATALFERATVERLATSFEAILGGALGGEADAVADALRESELVTDAAVVARDGHDGACAPRAYVVPSDEAAALDDEDLLAALRTQLARRLPSATAPAAWCLLTRLPRDADGRLDVAALPRAAARSNGGGDDDDARASIASVVHEIWRRVLAQEDVGRGTTLFAAGGQSLDALRIVNRIEQRFAIDVPLDAFLREPTIAATVPTVARLLAERDAKADGRTR